MINLPNLTLSFIAVTVTLSHAAPEPVFIMENHGLKNTYRVVFHQFDEQSKVIGGAFEILGDDDGRAEAHTRMPFHGTLIDGPDQVTMFANVTSSALFSFFPPTNKSDPAPSTR